MEMEMLLAKNKMLLLMLSPQRQGGNHLSGSISIPAEFAAVNLARIDLSAHPRRCSIGRPIRNARIFTATTITNCCGNGLRC